jgi:threonylcarbamoyladenosine tRNA methylthiotransferase MtaB
MTTFSIHNFGCRATDADAALLRHELQRQGLVLIDDHSRADVVVLNTCTVTAAADAEARETVRKVHRANPSARIVVAGCYAQRAPGELATLPGVALVVGNSHLAEIPSALTDAKASAASFTEESPRDFVGLAQIEGPISLDRGPAKILSGDMFAEATLSLPPAAALNPDRTRPILKIQDGCNNRCSYCVIPFVRGRSRSLPPTAVIHEIRTWVAARTREIVLSGINLGSYGRDLTPRTNLASLIERILRETTLERLRLSSIEPQDVTKDFIDLVASSDRVAPHFHLPLQSGSNKILKAMYRWYRAEHYAERIRLIREELPHAGIGADVIVGFPGEADEDFRATVELVEDLPFTYLHVFSFSERPGTQAASLRARVAPPMTRERAHTLRAIAQRKSAAFRRSEAGRRLQALTLNRTGENWTEALTGNYLKVRIAGRIAANQWYYVEISEHPEEAGAEVSVSARKRLAAAVVSSS